MSKKIMIVAGGTGGHIFPGIAVSDYLKSQNWQVVWLGTEDRMEAEVVPRYGIDIRFIDMKGVRGNGMVRLIKAPFMVLKAIFQARKIMKKEKPDVLLGMGGYVTGPAGVAAKTLSIPVLIHEQNAVAGMSNKLLAKIADQVMAAFPSAFDNIDCKIVGNPVRRSLVIDEAPSNHDGCNILVVGGSLGAKVFNDSLPAVFKALAKDNKLSIWHQTGKGYLSEVSESYQASEIDAQVKEFIYDMDKAYAWADIVICRAGALTVSEIAAAGKMAVFVPYPHAVDDHQTANANYLVDRQAALLIQQKNMNTANLTALLKPYIDNKELIKEIAKKAKQAASLHATQDVANLCIELSK
jgi:UDP-N-acetylglucosamine--N-acetylmuramyl-(pentapeptide) pyrophosphoryl-undecaprenol N-acetylglucosamine transferase